jgi:hypothetical protein
LAGRNYTFSSNATNTQSATLPLATIISTANIRPKLYQFRMASDASPNDQSFKFGLQRCTSAGTPGSTPTPSILQGDPAAQVTCGLAVFSVGPTLTANDFPLWDVAYMRGPYRWDCKDGREIYLPATANNGLALMSLVLNGAAYNVVFGFTWEE